MLLRSINNIHKSVRIGKMIDCFRNVFVLAPHTDDGELGVGGTIAKLVECGADVYYFAFSTAQQSVPEGFSKDILKTEVVDALLHLGISKENIFVYNYEVRKFNYFRQDILERLIQRKKELMPDLVFMPSLGDIHQDHFTIAREGLRAFKNSTILSYELIWNNIGFNATSFIRLSEKQLRQKAESLAMYRSQRFRAYMNREFIFSLAKTRGVQFGCEYCECFEVVRWAIG